MSCVHSWVNHAIRFHTPRVIGYIHTTRVLLCCPYRFTRYQYTRGLLIAVVLGTINATRFPWGALKGQNDPKKGRKTLEIIILYIKILGIQTKTGIPAPFWTKQKGTHKKQEKKHGRSPAIGQPHVAPVFGWKAARYTWTCLLCLSFKCFFIKFGAHQRPYSYTNPPILLYSYMNAITFIRA